MNTVRGRSTGFLLGSLFVVTLAWWGCSGGGSTDQASSGNGGDAGEAPAATDGGNDSGDDGAAGGDPGQMVYSLRCVTCHGESGKGDGPAGIALDPPPRDHTDAEYMSTLTDDEIRTTILKGKGAMPPHEGILTDDELDAVMIYVRSLSQ